MNYYDPEIFERVKHIKSYVDRMSEEELGINLDRCMELMGMEIPEKYFDEAHALIFFIKERLEKREAFG